MFLNFSKVKNAKASKSSSILKGDISLSPLQQLYFLHFSFSIEEKKNKENRKKPEVRENTQQKEMERIGEKKWRKKEAKPKKLFSYKNLLIVFERCLEKLFLFSFLFQKQ